MKKLVGWILAWICYWLGHWISFPMLHFDLGILYPFYLRLMCWSIDIQDWSGVEGPWKKKTIINE